MYVVTVAFTISAAHYTEFMEAMVANARSSCQEEAGCRQFDVCESPAQHGKVFLTQVCQLLAHSPISSAANPHGCWGLL